MTEHTDEALVIEQVTTAFTKQMYGTEFCPFDEPEAYDHCEKAVRAILPLIRTTDAARIAELEAALRQYADGVTDTGALARATLRSNPDDPR